MSDSSPSDVFIPISPNPFIVGNPVRDPAMFFGRESEFELVRLRFQNAIHGGLIVFCGERRSGKTSILFQILQGRLGASFIPVLIDMQSMAIGDEIEFFGRIVQEIIDATGPECRVAAPDFNASAKPSTVFYRFVEKFVQAHTTKKLILLFDEYELFENKIESGVLTEDVLNILSSLMENQSVFLVFTGSQYLEQRRRTYWQILPKSIYRTISYLQPEDTRRLIRTPVDGRVDYQEGTVDAICRLVAGQPFYTQAICQSLVDSLNEKKTNTVTREILDAVVRGIVENPFPQMIFLWDGLEPDEKLVLSLVAEVLDRDDQSATADALVAHIRDARYPVDLTVQRASAALEGLFRSELLDKDSAQPAGYAFRMDLWRLWIRRMHSAWQVMRELGIEVHREKERRGPRPRLVRSVIVLGVLILASVAGFRLLTRPGSERDHGQGGRTAGAGEPAAYWLGVEPRAATISRDGLAVGTGEYRDTIGAGVDIPFRVAAPGYADSTFVVRAAPHAQLVDRVALRPLQGDLRVLTDPPGALIWVDGVSRGKSPVTLEGMDVPNVHTVRAVAEGMEETTRSVAVIPDSVLTIELVLGESLGSLQVSTSPTGADLLVDGRLRLRSPTDIPALPLSSSHTIRAMIDGYRTHDTTVVVTSERTTVHMRLREESPGVLELQGDGPANMYVDGKLVAEGLPNSGRLELRVGSHEVKVAFLSGKILTTSIEVRPQERVVYDFSTESVTGRYPMGDSQP